MQNPHRSSYRVMWPALVLATSLAPALASPIIAPSDSMPASVHAGELLLAELNCTACHSATEALATRLNSRLAPRLGEDGIAMTSQYLRSFLLDPHAEKPGSTMPDVLHSFSAPERTEIVEALVHYLISGQRRSDQSPTSADVFKIEQGRLLYHRIGCVACHAPHEPVSELEPKTASAEAAATSARQRAMVDRLSSTSIPLGNLGKKMTVDELSRFLMNPLKARPSGRMPSFNLAPNEATALAMYLLRDQAPGLNDRSVPPQRTRGLTYDYFEGGFSGNMEEFESLKPRATGLADAFRIDARLRDSNFGFRFTGLLAVQHEGDYTFFTHSDDGSRLYIGTQLVVRNDGHHGMEEAQGTIRLPKGDHPIAVTYFNGGGEWGLKVSYQGPQLQKQEIPPAVLSHLGQPMVPLGAEPFHLDAAKAQRGRQLFSSLGCADCHEPGSGSQPRKPPAKSLASLNPGSPEGCLGERAGKEAPKFNLSTTQRESLRAALTRLNESSHALDPSARVTRIMASLNCFGCHSRDGAGGPSIDRMEYFSSVGEVDLGDEGRIPPHLTKVGNKLRPEWLREVLIDQGKVRPYMATRMPQFGRANLEPLLHALIEADGPHLPEPATRPSLREVKLGRKLVGREGLTCIACHTFGKVPSLGVPAMDLTQMAKRIRKDWFHRYLIDPASLRPGTRMPTFWPDGEATNAEILDGDTGKQIDAIWAYLSEGSQAEIPDGLIQAKMELVPEKEAIIYRNFVEGASARAIAVGYPERAHLAFNANELRIALIWQGAFLDASRHRADRGSGFVPPLGTSVIRMPPGPPFAILENDQAAWPSAVGEEGGYQMKGYRLDEQRRPTFLYSYHEIQIQDRPVAVPGELDPKLVRTIAFTSAAPVEGLWFRAAAGSRVEPVDRFSFVVDDRVQLRFELPNGGQPLLRQSAGRTELLVPVHFVGRDARLLQEIVW